MKIVNMIENLTCIWLCCVVILFIVTWVSLASFQVFFPELSIINAFFYELMTFELSVFPVITLIIFSTFYIFQKSKMDVGK
jgi:hypothetical protein